MFSVDSVQIFLPIHGKFIDSIDSRCPAFRQCSFFSIRDPFIIRWFSDRL